MTRLNGSFLRTERVLELLGSNSHARDGAIGSPRRFLAKADLATPHGQEFPVARVYGGYLR